MATVSTVTRQDQEQQTLDPEIVALLPEQGAWTERDYLWLTERTNRLVELADGSVEVLVPPTERHQAIVACLLIALHAFMQRTDGKVLFAPFRLRLGPRKFREPDLLVLRSAEDPRRHNDYWEGADLVVEIVSPDDPRRDLVTKRADYAEAGIGEYWIVDPQRETITVLRLSGKGYAEHGVFRRGQRASSALFAEFSLSVDEVLDAE